MDVGPPPAGRPGALSLHHLALIYLGVHVLDNMDLTAVSEAAAERNRWEFAVTIAPADCSRRDRRRGQSDRDVPALALLVVRGCQ